MNIHSAEHTINKFMTNTLDPIQAQLVATRRAQILDAATKVFAEKGFTRATVRDIAKTAGIADGTIYNYFKNKDDVLLAILDRLNETDQRAEQFAHGIDGDFTTFFQAYLRRRIATIWPNAGVFRAVLPEVLVNTELRERYYQHVIAPSLALAERYFQTQISQGHMRPTDAPLAARAVAGSVLGLLLLQLFGDEQLASRSDELPDVLAALFINGMKDENEKMKDET
jgi:AcrR family transcriptional regulator